ncbi:hypothetical protein PDQ32_31010, partial [Bacillus cereus]|nr:hypothetical protein [Bacillus cereus]
MIKKIAIILCSFVIILVSFNPSIYADSPSYQVVGSKGVSIENKGLNGGYYSLTLKVTDAENVVKFQLSELMLVNDCSFNFGLVKWTRPSQEKNEFDINIKENGTYAFYVFANGKVKGYVRFKIKGFPKNAEGTGVTQYWGEGAKYYELPEEAVNPDDFRDQDGANNGICVNEKIPDDKPSGSGEIEEPNNNNNGGNNNGGSNEKLDKALKDINDALKNIETSSKDTANNTKDIADNTGKIKDAVNSINDTLREILDEMKPTTDVVIDELKKPDLIKPEDENEKFEDKNEYFKEGKEEKVPTDALPDAPDPKPWKDEDGKEMTKEDKSEKDKPTEKD